MDQQLIWTPSPRQAKALSCPAFELFFGGARGGGKSDFLLMDYAKNTQTWGGAHRGVLFRRSMPELEELIQRSHELYSHIAIYKVGEKLWVFHSGATLRMRFLENDLDVHKYQGHQYSWVGFDELTNWATDYCYKFIANSCARSAPGAPVRIRSSGNPGSVGHVWVRSRFINPAPPETVFTDPATGLTRVFIPSLLDDNLVLMKNDPLYEKRLQGLPSHLYRAYRWGDWNVFAGQVFEEWREERHVVKPFRLDPSWFRFCSMDWGYAKPYSIGFWCVTGDGRMIRFAEMYGRAEGDEIDTNNVGSKEHPSKVAEAAWDMAAAYGIEDMVADPACWAHQGERCTADYFEDAGFTMYHGNRDRVSGLTRFHDLLKTDGSDGRPSLLVFSGCRDFIRTIPALTHDERNPEDVDTRAEDHIYDESRYAIMSELALMRRGNRRINPQDLNKSRGQADRDRVINYDPYGRGKNG